MNSLSLSLLLCWTPSESFPVFPSPERMPHELWLTIWHEDSAVIQRLVSNSAGPSFFQRKIPCRVYPERGHIRILPPYGAYPEQSPRAECQNGTSCPRSLNQPQSAVAAELDRDLKILCKTKGSKRAQERQREVSPKSGFRQSRKQGGKDLRKC